MTEAVIPIRHWGEEGTVTHTFCSTPFGRVMLNNFQKVGIARFALWLTILDGDKPRNITWWDCDASDAAMFFGIHITEQNMWSD